MPTSRLEELGVVVGVLFSGSLRAGGDDGGCSRTPAPVRNKLPRREGGREVFSGGAPTPPPPNPPVLSSIWGVKRDPGKGNLFPAAPPSDSGQREGEGTSKLPQLLRGHESAKGPQLISSSWGTTFSLQAPSGAPLSLLLPLPLQSGPRTPVPFGPWISGTGSLSHSIPKGSLIRPLASLSLLPPLAS